MRLLIITNLLLLTLTLPYSIFASSSSNCDYDNLSVTLKAKNKPINDIFKEIESQIKYTIDVHNPELISISKSINLYDAPLEQTIKRILKGINYSIICDEKEKLLSLFIAKDNLQNLARTSTSGNESNASNDSSLFPDIKPGLTKGTNATPSNQTNLAVDKRNSDRHPFADLDEALDDYQNKKSNGQILSAENDDIAMSDPFPDLSQLIDNRNNAPPVNNNPLINKGNSNKHPFAELDEALDDYQNKKSNGQISDPANDDPSMSDPFPDLKFNAK